MVAGITGLLLKIPRKYEPNRHPCMIYVIANSLQCLSDIVESYIGAIFVDSKFDFGEVERFFEEHIRYFFEDMRIYDTFANNHPMVSISLVFGASSCALWVDLLSNARRRTYKTI